MVLDLFVCNTFAFFVLLLVVIDDFDVVYAFSATSSVFAIDADGLPNPRWSSCCLPLPEHCADELTAERSRRATAGRNPLALRGRCEVDFDVGSGVRFAHVDPPVLVVDDLLTRQECVEVLRLTSDRPPPEAGRILRFASQSYDDDDDHRISTTWYVRYGAAAVAPLLDGATALLPRVALERIEEVQLVRYVGSGEGFSWHEDALEEQHLTPDCGGQRVATCLIYLDENCDEGGGGGGGRTVFRDLLGKDGKRLSVCPKVGRALLFFPAVTGEVVSNHAAFGERLSDGTRSDRRTVHAGEPPGGKGTKHIAQLWIHNSDHTPFVFGEGLNKHMERYM